MLLDEEEGKFWVSGKSSKYTLLWTVGGALRLHVASYLWGEAVSLPLRFTSTSFYSAVPGAKPSGSGTTPPVLNLQASFLTLCSPFGYISLPKRETLSRNKRCLLNINCLPGPWKLKV